MKLVQVVYCVSSAVMNAGHVRTTCSRSERGNVIAESNWETDHKAIFCLLIYFQENSLHLLGFSQRSVAT